MGAPGNGPPVARMSPGVTPRRPFRAASTCWTVALNARLGVVCGARVAAWPDGGIHCSWKFPAVGAPLAVIVYGEVRSRNASSRVSPLALRNAWW